MEVWLIFGTAPIFFDEEAVSPRLKGYEGVGASRGDD
jgi:hypothetical protein